MEKKQNTKRNNKGVRPPKSTTDKLKYRVIVKLATPDYYAQKSRARRHIGKRIPERMFP